MVYFMNQSLLGTLLVIILCGEKSSTGYNVCPGHIYWDFFKKNVNTCLYIVSSSVLNDVFNFVLCWSWDSFCSLRDSLKHTGMPKYLCPTVS